MPAASYDTESDIATNVVPLTVSRTLIKTVALACIAVVMLVAVTHDGAATHDGAGSAADSFTTELGANDVIQQSLQTGAYVQFKGGKDGKYCGFDKNDRKVKCTFTDGGARETKFNIVDGGSLDWETRIVLKYTDHFCDLHHDGTEVQCRQDPWRWTLGWSSSVYHFTDTSRASGNGRDRSYKNNFSFKSRVGDKYKICSDNGNDGIKCNRNKLDSWETFHMTSDGISRPAATELKGGAD